MTSVAPHILVAGSYGQGNIGDEAILAGLLGQLRSRFARASWTVVVGCFEAMPPQPDVRLLHWTDWAGIRQAMQTTDYVLVGGGGLFFDYGNFDPQRLLEPGAPDLHHFASFPLLAHLLGKPFMLYACGVGPLHSAAARAVVGACFAAADAATVRDRESAELLAELGVGANSIPVVPDPALTIEPAPPAVAARLLNELGIDRSRPLVCLVVPHLAMDGWQGQYLGTLARAVAGFMAARKAQLLIFPFQPAYDQPTTEILQRQLPDQDVFLIATAPTPPEAAAILACCDLLVTVRLHAAVLGALRGTPVITIPYAAKVRSFANQIGMDSFCLEPDRLAELPRLLDQLWSDRRGWRELIAAKAEQLKHDAERLAELTQTRIQLACLSSAPRPLFAGELEALIRARLAAADDLQRVQETQRAYQVAMDHRFTELEKQLQDLTRTAARLTSAETSATGGRCGAAANVLGFQLPPASCQKIKQILARARRLVAL